MNASPGRERVHLRVLETADVQRRVRAASPSPGATRLVDAFGREHTYVRIAVTERCNLRCAYCMPNGHAAACGRDRLLTFEEIERLVRLLAARGVHKVRFTGGEPLLRKGLPELIGRVAALDGVRSIGVTTNGVLLERYAASLREAGLAAVNVSLDSLSAPRFHRITGSDSHATVLRGIAVAVQAGLRVKLNVVVMRGVNDDELPEFVELARERAIDVRFIEYMPFKENGWREAGFIPYVEMRDVLLRQYALEPVDDGNRGSVAKQYRVAGTGGRVAFITSISEHFCDRCNRLRVTADGSVKSCLFHPAEENVRDVLRAGGSDRDVLAAVERALGQKPAAHPGVDELLTAENRSMMLIGG